MCIVMASLDLDEIDDFLSSLDPENYSLRHAFMPMDQDDDKKSYESATRSPTERKYKHESIQTSEREGWASQFTTSETETAEEEVLGSDRSPDSSTADENLPPSCRPIREQDRFLPLAVVSRLMKEGIPPTAKISRGARHLLQECVSEFIAFVTSEAIERCLDDRRKTLTGEDLIAAMVTLGFDNYVLPMSLYHDKIKSQLRGDNSNLVVQREEPNTVVKAERNISLLPISKSLVASFPKKPSKNIERIRKSDNIPNKKGKVQKDDTV